MVSFLNYHTILGNKKATDLAEKYVFTILSVVFGWLPAIIVAMFPLVTSDVHYAFNVNSLTVQNDGTMTRVSVVLSLVDSTKKGS